MFSKKAIERAGDVLRKENLTEDELQDAMTKLSYWRSLHDSPLRKVNKFLKNGLTHLKLKSSFISFRLKTEHSISVKLKRFPRMSLRTMGDIAGCRVIVSNLKDLNKFQRWLKKEVSKVGVELKLMHDYLKEPKTDGYRSVHYQIKYDSHKVEVQLRTSLQHSWATSVEVIDTMKFGGTGLKHGLEGGEFQKWAEFFTSLSNYCKYLEESCSHLIIPKSLSAGSPSQKDNIRKQLLARSTVNPVFYKIIVDLKKKISSSKALNVLQRCACSADAATKSLDSLSAKSDGYFLVEVIVKEMNLTVNVKHFLSVTEADPIYQAMEIKYREDRIGACYLVAVQNVGMLNKAYPNFFADTSHILANISI